MRDEALATICLNYIKNFLGVPYKWAGDDPMNGFDCSGVVVEYLKCAGIIKESDDYTADQLQSLLLAKKIDFPSRGCLVFFGRTKATHVGICLNETHMIEAGGGGVNTVTVEDAKRQNAFLKIRPIVRRRDILGYADPFLR